MSSSWSAGCPTVEWSSANCSLPLDVVNGMESTNRVCMGMEDVAVAMTLVILIFATIIGNVLVVLSIAVYRRMRTFANVLLVSLATADLLVGLMVMPIALVDQLHKHRWQFGLILCKIWTTTDVLLCTASILNLCVISLDRYFAITSPLRYTRTRSQSLAAGIVTAVWLVSLVISSPPWFIPQWKIHLEDDTACGYAKATAYRIYSALGSFYIPLVIMLFVYFKIFRVASNREKVLNAERRGSRTMQMWQQQATRRAARNSLAASAAVGATLAFSKSCAGVGGSAQSPIVPSGVPMRSGTLRQYEMMKQMEDHSEDEDSGRGTRAGSTIRGISTDPRRKKTPDSTNSYYRHMNRCDSPLKQVKFTGLGDFNQQYHQEQRNRLRFRFQRTPTEDLMDAISESASNWRSMDREQNTTAGDSFSDLTTIGRPTTGLTRTSTDYGRIRKDSTMESSRQGGPTTTSVRSTSSPNNVPLLSDHARRYFERTVPWSLVRKANEYYINSKPLRPSREKMIYLKERKALKTIGIVVSGFIICWLPFFILYLIEAACFAYSPPITTFTPFSTAPSVVTTTIAWTTQTAGIWNSSFPSAGRFNSGGQSVYAVAFASAAAAADYSTFAALASRSSTLTTPTIPHELSSISPNLIDSSGTPTGHIHPALLVCSVPPILADLFLWLGYSNSVINPLIYTFYNRDFRRCFKDLLSGGCLRRNAANRRMSVRRLHQTRL